MAIFRIILLGLALVLPVLSSRGDNEWMIDSRENWDVIIRQFCDTMAHTRATLAEEKVYLQQWLKNFDKGLLDVEKRSSELYYLFWNGSQNDVLSMSMYARQICDLKRGVDTQVGILQRTRGDWSDDQAANLRVRESLNKIPRTYLSPESFSRLESCKREWDYYVECGRDAINMVDRYIQRGTELQKKINEIYEGSEKRRNATMQRVIFTRCGTLWEALPYAKLVLKDWWGYLVNWLEIEVPDNIDFWRSFLLLLLCAGGPLCVLGYPIFKYIFKSSLTEEKKKKLILFILAWSVMILSLFCFYAKLFMLDLVEGAFFTHVGHFLFATSWLVLALLVRVNSTMMKRCLILYAPVVFQYLGGILLEIAVIPYAPLVLILPGLTLPMVLLLMVFLIRLDCPLMDRIFGILTVFLGIATITLSVIGLPYIGFTIIMVWFVAMSGLQAGIVLTMLIRTYVARNAQHKIMSSMLLTLLTPAMWMFIISVLIYWTAGMYNRQAFLDHILISDFLHCKNVIEISLVDVLTTIAVGFILQFIISTIKHLIHSIYGHKRKWA